MSTNRDFFAEVRTAKEALAAAPEYKRDKVADDLKYRLYDSKRVLATARAELAIEVGQRQQVEGWPAGVVARYVSVGGTPLGLGVDITAEYTTKVRDYLPLRTINTPAYRSDYERSSRVVDLTYTATCLGCGESDRTEYSDVDVTKLDGHIDQTGSWNGPKPWAQAHAETCRAMPKPEAAS